MILVSVAIKTPVAIPEQVLDIVQIRLLPNYRQATEAIEQEANELEVNELEVIEELVQPVVSEALLEPAVEVAEEQSMEEQSTELSPATLAESTPAEAPAEPLKTPQQSTPLNLPSIVTIQKTITEMEKEKRSRIYVYDCNYLEEEAGIRTCEPTDNRDYGLLERSSVYESFQPRWQRSRSRETLGVLASQSSDLAARLAANNLPAGLSEYVMAETEAGIEVYSNNGNTRLVNMQKLSNLVRKEAAAAHAERILGDHWVQNQRAALRARRYRTQQQIKLEQTCKTTAAFKLIDGTLLRCLKDN